ncbi:hypothetical protein ACRQ5Q_16855 [Bradyrhizobium sp. PMVTL-01]|uniref:hypothetical protein n=1 Tax=Bradyrhizobium sp. PMVTL-01 TaxID=3434999 RepID=UPI003F730EF1
MTVTEMWKPIASLSTEDEKDAELRMPGGNIEIGHFSPVQRRWQIRTGSYTREHEQQPGVMVRGTVYKLLEGVYPTHWRPLSSSMTRPNRASEPGS